MRRKERRIIKVREIYMRGADKCRKAERWRYR